MKENAIADQRQTLRQNDQHQQHTPAVDRHGHFSDGSPMASHHWTDLDGWDLYAGSWHVSSQDLTREQLGDELRQVCDEYGEQVGGLLIQGVEPRTMPHMIMLAGQTALEEKITVRNATWTLSQGESNWHVTDHVTVAGNDHLEDNTYRVLPLPSRTSLTSQQQLDTEALRGELTIRTA
jgi:hypothetical protein